MTDFGTMSVTRSLSISTRNTSTTSGIPHFQSGFGTFYGSMPLKDHDLTSMTYPGFYGNHSGEFFPSQPVNNGLSINSGGTTCHQQQFQQQQQQQQHNQEHHHYHHQQQQQQQQQHQQQQQQQQNKRRGEWITFSKPFLLKLVEKLCQLSFETEVVPSPAPEVSSQGGPVEQKVKTNQSSVNILTGNPSVSPSEATNSESSYSPSISLATTALTTATTTPLVNVQTSNDKININDSSSGVCSRKSRQKSRPVKFVRPFESSEERQKSEDSDINVESDDDDDNDDTTKKNNNKSSGNSSNTISAVVSPTPVNPSCVAVAANSLSAVSVVAGGKSKENLKRERDACEDSETEHVNVEDDDDDDGDTNAPTAKTKTTDHPGSENIHGREVTGKDQSILERSFQSAKLHFNPGSSSAPPPPTHHPHHHLFNPLWSEYFKLNFGLQPTYQPAFNSHKGTPQAEPSRQSWAAFNKSLVYKMFDEVLDNDKTHNGAATYQPGAQPAQSALHDARFLFASHRPGHLGLHLSNGLDKHLGTYDVAFCQGRVGQVRDSHDDDRENKRSSVGQVRNKRLRDGFARGRHQLINKRNKVRSSCATKVTCPRNSGLERKEQSERSNCKDANPVCDVPILGALLSSNDTKLYSSNRSLHNSVNNNNNSNKNVKVCSEQQHNTILKPTTANNNNNASPISCDIPLKNGLRQNPSSGKVEGWPKWVALDKGQVKSLVDSLVATMMGTGDGQSPSSCQSMTPPPPPPPKSRDDDSEMQVDGNSNEESSQQHQQQQLQQQQQTATSGDVSVEEDIKDSADVDHATSNNSSGTSTYQSPQSSPKSCGVEIERSAPPTHNNNNENSSSSSSSNRDSETETNFSGDTQLDQSDLDEYSGRQVEEDMSDDGESSARDADTDDCARMECHSTHRRCPIKWKSNMLKRMKAEKRRPET